MLPKTKRLTKAAFDTYFKTGKRHHTPSLQIIYAPSDTFHGAAVVGKKVYKRAVDRNKLRRQLYAVMYRLHRQQPRTGVYIIIAKPKAAAQSFTDLRDEVRAAVGAIHKTG